MKTIDLSAMHKLLKDAGVKCTKRDLCIYLDDRGITHIDRGGVGTAPGGDGGSGGGNGEGGGDEAREGRGGRGRRGGPPRKKRRSIGV